MFTKEIQIPRGAPPLRPVLSKREFCPRPRECPPPGCPRSPSRSMGQYLLKLNQLEWVKMSDLSREFLKTFGQSKNLRICIGHIFHLSYQLFSAPKDWNFFLYVLIFSYFLFNTNISKCSAKYFPATSEASRVAVDMVESGSGETRGMEVIASCSTVEVNITGYISTVQVLRTGSTSSVQVLRAGNNSSVQVLGTVNNSSVQVFRTI